MSPNNSVYAIVVDVWLGFKAFYKNLDFEFALGGALGGSWVAGLGLEILPTTIAFTQLNIDLLH